MSEALRQVQRTLLAPAGTTGKARVWAQSGILVGSLAIIVFLSMGSAFTRAWLRPDLPAATAAQPAAAGESVFEVVVPAEGPYYSKLPAASDAESLGETIAAHAVACRERGEIPRLRLRVDREAPFGRTLALLDAAKAAGIEHVHFAVSSPDEGPAESGQPAVEAGAAPGLMP